MNENISIRVGGVYDRFYDIKGNPFETLTKKDTVTILDIKEGFWVGGISGEEYHELFVSFNIEGWLGNFSCAISVFKNMYRLVEITSKEK